ncbi:MAG: flotillin family protein [Opitutales bacterium]
MHALVLAQAEAVIFGLSWVWLIIIGTALFALIGFILSVFHKAQQGYAFVRTGFGGTRVFLAGCISIPVLHRLEIMDLRVQTLQLDRRGKDGLICKDNVRADITVGFYVRVNPTEESVREVARRVGCQRASDIDKLRELFDAKFSEALKTAGKQFDFEELYTKRLEFREKIKEVIESDLEAYALTDVAIDYLEQTGVDSLNPNNILDSEGIKKITDLTAKQMILENEINNNRIRTIKQNDVERIEAVLELEKQQAEAEEKQKREIAVISAREDAESKRVQEEQRQRAEQARIAAEEEIQIANQNMERQVIVAEKNKQKTEAIETERVERDRQLEIVERDKVTSLAEIEKTKALEIEKRNIQDVIKERVMVEKTVVIEQEKIKDTEAFATADRQKRVTLTAAEEEAEEKKIKQLKAAEASKEAEQMKADEDFYRQTRKAEAGKRATELAAEEMVISAEAEETSSTRTANAKKTLAEATAAETAATGLGEAQVMEAKAAAKQKEGEADAHVMELKAAADAKGIHQKAEAMKLFNEAGKEHEEFKLRLEKEKTVELEAIRVNEQIAEYQAKVLGESLKNTKVDIVGGSADFYSEIVGAVTRGKSFERMLGASPALADVKETFFNGDPEYFKSQLSSWLREYGVNVDTVKDLSIAALLMKLAGQTDDPAKLQKITSLQGLAEKFGLAMQPVGKLLTTAGKN